MLIADLAPPSWDLVADLQLLFEFPLCATRISRGRSSP